MADSEAMAEYSERTLAFTAESLASCEYPESARNPMAARIAKTAITTTSSARVNPVNLREAAFLNAFETREETESVSGRRFVFRILRV